MSSDGAEAVCRPHVHIVLSDKGWIIEELARRLTERLPYVTVDAAPDPAATVQYYMTYSARTGRVSPVELALFTHREDDPAASRRFDETARTVDHAVAMSHATERLLAGLGVERRSCISPGVDLERFRPRLRIAVVGRTYHTGRKGEALVRAVMDVPDIDWLFTGIGWPGPALNVPDEELPSFYRSVDYVLVPATNEGGPMSVLEALASGTPVIASDVGWAAEFPRIAFARDDPASLRAVLERLRAERFALRDSVSGMTWANWAAAHDALFARLAAQAPPSSSRPAPATSRRVRSVALVTHGAEDTTLGGPSVRVPRTRAELERLQLRVVAGAVGDRRLATADVVHGFNIWLPAEAYRMARWAERLGKPFVFSPILLDLSEAPFWQVDLLRTFRGSATAAEAEARLAQGFADFQGRDLPPADFEPGHAAALGAIDRLSAATIFLSEHERRLFERVVGAPPRRPHLVPNPVDIDQFDGVRPDLFRQTYGLGDYVLCVGRLEHRKNQLALAAALASTGLPLVLIGHEVDAEYTALVRRFGGPHLHLVGRLEPGSELLRSAVLGARVFALPSWAEGAPLAALEAGAAGVPLVLSNRSSERAYFGDHARYCDPASLPSIRDEILAAWEVPDRGDGAGHQAMMRERYGWERHAQATRDVYEAAIVSRPEVSLPTAVAIGPRTGVVLDLTTWANNSGTLSGIVRVECAIARALAADAGLQVRFIVYEGFDHFVEVPRSVVADGSFESYVALLRRGLVAAVPADAIADCSDLVTVGSGWMQNISYALHVAAFARRRGMRLNMLMHDMTPYLFPQWYDEGYAGRWTANCRAVLARADRVLTYSRNTMSDVARFCLDQELDRPELASIRLADEIGDFASVATPAVDGGIRASIGGRPFVLAVGGLHVRKNYGLLFDVWTMLHEQMEGPPPLLVIVGGPAWNGRDTARALQEDPRVRDHILMLKGVNDAMLAWLYEHCLFTLYPSLYEGWGLPVGESLARGKICLSSNSSSMPEISPALTDLLPPLDRAAWAARIIHYAGSASSRRRREEEIRQGYAVTSWTETAADLARALETPARAPRAEPYLLGSIALCNDGPGARYLDAGWYPAEQWGSWAGSHAATLRFRLAEPANEDLVLTLLARVLKPDTAARTCRVEVNGAACGTIAYLPMTRTPEIAPSIGRLRVPFAAIAGTDEVVIRLEMDGLSQVNEVSPQSTDRRQLGLGLSAFLLQRASHAGDAPRLLSTRPEVRALLGAPVNQDLGRMLAEHPARPSPRLGRQLGGPGDLVRFGTASGDTVRSTNGMLALAFGTARFRLDQELAVDLLIDDAEDQAPCASIEVFVNDEQVLANRSGEAGRRLTVRLSPAILGMADPLRLVLAGGKAGPGRQGADFVLRAVRLSQPGDVPAVPLPRGGVINLDTSDGDDDDGQAPLLVNCTGADGNSVLLVEGSPGLRSGFVIEGTKVDATVSIAGRSLLALKPRADGTVPVAVDLRCAAVSRLPGNDAPRTGRMAHVGLTDLNEVGEPVEARHVPLDGWHEAEEGLRWGEAERVSLLVRPHGAATITITGELLIDATQVDLSACVDGMAAEVRLEPLQQLVRLAIHVTLPPSPSPIRLIELAGLPVHRPCDLGINADGRTLSLRIHDIAA